MADEGNGRAHMDNWCCVLALFGSSRLRPGTATSGWHSLFPCAGGTMHTRAKPSLNGCDDPQWDQLVRVAVAPRAFKQGPTTANRQASYEGNAQAHMDMWVSGLRQANLHGRT